MQPFGPIKQFEIAGVDGIIMYFAGKDIGDANLHVSAYVKACIQQQPAWLLEVVPSYDSILVIYDALAVDSHCVYQFLRGLNVSEQHQIQTKAHQLPVWYGAPEANDLALVGARYGLTNNQVIDIHCQQTYQVFAVGFAPGFAYLGEVDPRIACPRLTTPRMRVPAGAVAIADTQTAVYPSESPGGWNLLGLCPVSLFSVNPEPQNVLQVGDTVRFYPINQREYEHAR